jgi:polyisoprenoid-binding protein YceI
MSHRRAPGEAAVMTTNTPYPGTYQIDPERSVITFRTRHLFGLGPVRGTFRLRAGEIRVAEQVQASAVRATVDAASFATGNPVRDRAVTSARLLDTGQHPVFTFASSQLTPDGDRWTLRGSLAVAGNALPVELAIEQAHADGPEMSVLATVGIDRYAFGVRAMKGLAARRLSCQLEIVATRRDDDSHRG